MAHKSTVKVNGVDVPATERTIEEEQLAASDPNKDDAPRKALRAKRVAEVDAERAAAVKDAMEKDAAAKAEVDAVLATIPVPDHKDDLIAAAVKREQRATTTRSKQPDSLQGKRHIRVIEGSDGYFNIEVWLRKGKTKTYASIATSKVDETLAAARAIYEVKYECKFPRHDFDVDGHRK